MHSFIKNRGSMLGKSESRCLVLSAFFLERRETHSPANFCYTVVFERKLNPANCGAPSK